MANGLDSRSELDSHANMVVVGKDAFIFDGVDGKTCEVEPFDPSIGTAKRIPIVDAALAYDCPYEMKTYVLLIRNALNVKSMNNNLIPPFIMREAGIDVRDTPKIHLESPTEKDHSIYFHENSLRIPLQLWGVFSFFHTRKPTIDEINNAEKIFLTPDSTEWDPYSKHYALNEESMLDSDGKMQERKYRKKHIIGDYDFNPKDHYDDSIDNYVVSSISALSITDQVVVPDSNLISKSDIHGFATALDTTVSLSRMGASISSLSYLDDISDDLFQPISFQLDDEVTPLVSGVKGKRPTAVSAEFLSKIWDIKPDLAQKAIDQTTQLYRHGEDNLLSKHYSTNDRMLRYKRIESQFFTDTFFTTSKGKSTRGNTCAQIFVSDKGFVSIYPMTNKGQFQDDLHQFCKEVGVPKSLVVDPAGEQTSKPVRRKSY